MKIKSITPIGKREVYDITVKDVHHYMLENGVVTHNTAITYSANTIFVITKAQDKNSSGEIEGWHFTLNVHKSRYVREKSKFPFTVNYEQGLKPYSGMLDMAIELGAVVKPSNGWYSRVDLATGVIEDKKSRARDTEGESFWTPILKCPVFAQKVKDRYMLAAPMQTTDDSVEDAIEEVMGD